MPDKEEDIFFPFLLLQSNNAKIKPQQNPQHTLPNCCSKVM